MAVELKDVLEQLDFDNETIEYLTEDEEASVDDFQEQFKETFVSRKKAPQDDDIVKKVEGSRLGSVETKLKRTLGLEKGDIEDKQLEDIIDEHVKPKLDEIQKKEEQIKELEKKKAGSSKKKMKELQEKIEKKEEDIQQLKKQNKNIKQEKEQKEQEFKEYKLTQTINQRLEEAKKNVPLKKNMKQVEKNGLEAILENKYNFEYDEDEGQVKVLDRQTGEPVWNDKETDTLGPEEVIEKEAYENDLLDLGNDEGDDEPSGDDSPSASSQGGDDEYKRKNKKSGVHPDAEGFGNKIKQAADE